MFWNADLTNIPKDGRKVDLLILSMHGAIENREHKTIRVTDAFFDHIVMDWFVPDKNEYLKQLTGYNEIKAWHNPYPLPDFYPYPLMSNKKDLEAV